MQFVEFQVCRGCLATDTVMVDTRQHSVSDFTRLVELLPTSRVGLPPCVCYECLALLTKMRDFDAKNRRACNLLLEIIKQRGRIEETDIKQIDRTKHSLASSLKYTKIESISIDPTLSNVDVAVDDVNNEIIPENTEIQIEFKQETKIKSERCFEDFNDFSYDEPEEVKPTLDNKAEKEDVKETEPIKVKTERRIKKNVKNTILKNEKRKATKENSELVSGAEAQKLPKVRKKETARVLPLKLDSTKSCYTEDYHSFATVTAMTEEERLEVFKQRSVKQRYTDADYKCTDCYLGFTSFDTYVKHRKKHDPNMGAYVCPLCKCRYKTEKQQIKHTSMNHRTKFECKNCPYICTSGPQAKIHSKKHSSTTYRCKECKFKTAYLASYELHVSTMHGEEKPCPCCGLSFLDLRAMRTHMSAAHPKGSFTTKRDQRRFRCKCRAVFYNSDARKLHQSTSSKHNQDGSTLLCCALCDSRFTDKQSLQAHMSTHTQERKKSAKRPTSMTCEQCGEGMTDRKAYRKHFRQAHPDKTYSPTEQYADQLCDICGLICKGFNYLRDHKNLHKGLRPYVCKVCGKTYARRAIFDAHMNTHTKGRVYKCSVCGKGFNQFCNRDRHLLVHTQEKLFPCDTCGKSFKSQAHVLYHTRYVHMKKQWPKRERSKRKPTQQQQNSDRELSD